MAEANSTAVSTEKMTALLASKATEWIATSIAEGKMKVPEGYDVGSEMFSAMLAIAQTRDKNGRPALQVCTPASVSTALFQMATKGLNAALGQAYLLVRGDQLCLQESYFGKVLMVKRIYPHWNPNPVVIREGDVFEYSIDPATGRKYVVKHEQKLENMDKDFVGGYLYLPTGDLYIMTKKQILTAWSKSSSREQATHRAFSEKMVGKTLVNSGCNMIINSTPEYQMGMDEETNMIENKLPDYEDAEDQTYTSTTTDFEEVEEAVEEKVVEPVKVKEEVEEPTPVAEAPKDIEPNDDFEF